VNQPLFYPILNCLSDVDKMTQTIRSAEILSALSHALDLTEGQPKGHCMRTCWIGTQIGQAINLPPAEISELYYTLLLKDLGCSSNAARICQLYLTNDHQFKADFKLVDGSLSQALRFVLSHTGLESGMADRLRAVVNIMRNGGQISRELIEARCHRGADIAKLMGFSENVASSIQHLDEHWDGRGKPEGVAARAIPTAAQIALMAQVADVFHTASGREAAITEIKNRSGSWFAPDLVEVFTALADWDGLWEPLTSPQLQAHVLSIEPGGLIRISSEDDLDRVAKGFALVVDSKSPFTGGHSDRVAVFTDLIAEELGFDNQRRRWLRRAALLHDIGKLAISNSILDKPGKLTAEEFDMIKTHPLHSQSILKDVTAFADMAGIAGQHHERLDGKGYPFGLTADAISLETRIVTVSDVFDALTADRPYRKAMAPIDAFAIIDKDIGTAFDPVCVAALKSALGRVELAEAA
jgi:HD-GYP domain-containing protein (c-di-GMP phosphodiesterase class II)